MCGMEVLVRIYPALLGTISFSVSLCDRNAVGRASTTRTNCIITLCPVFYAAQNLLCEASHRRMKDTKYEVYILVLDVPCMILHCRTRLLSRAELMSATQGMWTKRLMCGMD